MCTYNDGKEYALGIWNSWVDYKDIDKIKVELVGKACEGAVVGVVLGSFNAG
jgi:hypothetical protein